MNTFISLLIYFLFFNYVTGSSGFSKLRQFFYNTISSSAMYDISNAEKATLTKRNAQSNFCDENKLMLNLANLEIISPERILLMLTKYDRSIQVCSQVTTTIRSIENDQKDCSPLDDDNLYVMLYRGLKMLELVFCKDVQYQHLYDENTECLRELREEYIDCEGPADWFEFPNKTIVCGTFNDIMSCDYVKTADLCGQETATFVNCLATKVMMVSLRHSCGEPILPEVKTAASSALECVQTHQILPIKAAIYILVRSYFFSK